MQIVASYIFVLFILFASSARLRAETVVTGASTPPSIYTQPTDQAAEYGSDVAFTVAATGDGLSYRWQKDGTRLTDQKNVAGANTSTLYLIGVSLENVGKYRVIITNSSGAIISSVVTLRVNPITAFRETFETGSLADNWSPIFETTNWLKVATNRNHTPHGIFSAGGTHVSSRMFHKLSRKLNGRVGLTFWMYDDGVSPVAYAELRGYQGQSGYAKYAHPSAIAQSLAIGYRSVVAGDTNSFVAEGQSIDPTKYQGGVLRASGKGNTMGWFNLDAPGAPSRTIGWHKFEIHRVHDQSAVDFYIDGVRAKRIRGAKPEAIDTVLIGLGGAGETNQLAGKLSTAWFDDIQVDAYPDSYDYENDPNDSVVPKLLQLREAGTGTVASNTAPITVFEKVGAAIQASRGKWAIEGQSLVATDFRGYVDYGVQAPADDMYRIEIEGREQNGKFPQANLPLSVLIDGEYLGHFNLNYTGQTNGLVHCFTPFIRAGAHTIAINCDNTRAGIFLRLNAVRLQSVPGLQSQNGMKQWVANRLSAQCGMDAGLMGSYVSPACVEGRGKYLSMMTLIAGSADTMSPVQVEHGIADRWYANVPLSINTPTRVEAYYQNGGISETNAIEWRVTNLMEAENVTIRKGDALLFTAVPPNAPNDAITITINNTALTSDASNPIPYTFERAGTFKVTGTYAGVTNRSIRVRVLEFSLDPVVPVFTTRPRWDSPKPPFGVQLSYDHRMRVQRLYIKPKDGARMNPPVPTNTIPYRLTDVSTAEPRYIVARLDKGRGPIIASTYVQGVQFAVPPETSLELVERTADGTEVIEGRYVLSPALPDLNVRFDLVTSGVSFGDGTLTKILPANAFDDLGLAKITFVRAKGVEGSVCNEATVYHKGVLVLHK